MNQPRPTPNEHTPSWDLVGRDLAERGEVEVLSDVRHRDAMGAQKYGTRLQPHNGRDSIRDAYEEAMDLVVYLRNAIEELPMEVPPTLERRNLNRMYQSALNLMCALRDYQDWKEVTRQFRETDAEALRALGMLKSTIARKLQDAPGKDPARTRMDFSFHSHSEHTGHPGTPQADVCIASQAPTIFIPPDLPPLIQESIEQWKAKMDEALRYEQARHVQETHPTERKSTQQFGDYL